MTILFYDSSVGETREYANWAALIAAETPTADDIVDFKNTEEESLNLDNRDGADGSPLNYRSLNVNGGGAVTNTITATGSDYIEIDGGTIQGSTARGLYATSGTGKTFKNLSILDGANRGIDISNLQSATFENISIILDQGANQAILSAGCSAVWRNIVTTGGIYGGRFEAGSHLVNGFKTSEATIAGVSIINIIESFVGIDMSVTGRAGAANANFLIDASLNVTLKRLTSVLSPNQAVLIQNGSNGARFYDGKVSGALVDGYHVQSSTDVEFHRCRAEGCGDSATSTTGDAFTSHEGCTGLKFHFCSSKNNLNTSHAHVSTAAGEIYHHTGINDGDPDNFSRAMLYIAGTGGFTVKNSVFMHNEEYSLGEIGPVNNNVCDYNAYISPIAPDASPFTINGVGATWAQWCTAVGDSNSMYIHKVSDWRYDIYKGSAPTVIESVIDYCPIDFNGKLVRKTDNPLIGAGISIAGVNDGAQTDHDGKPLRGGNVDIGAFSWQPPAGGQAVLSLTGF